ncbi:MAG: HlyD family efflux transporter periplasmic adaptor subunit, partial [Desulfuromusa sp.]|nr:HlyD family efflux transporter periplasmic adaptor subunit [Desulfuromusa sp.]
SCQRVSLGFMRHNQIRIEAISQTQKIDRQANFARALRDAMNEAVDQSSVLIYPIEAESSTLVIQMHTKLADQQQGSAICTIPLIKNGKAIGALLLERSIDEPFSEETVEQCQQVGLLIGPVLETRRREESPLPAKIYASLHSWLIKLFGPHHLPLKVTVTLSISLLLWLSLAGAMFHVSSDSFLEAGVCRAVVAPQQGFIASSAVRAGDLVQKGDLLATLDDQDLLLEQRKWQSQRAQLLKEYRQALAGYDRAEVAILKAKRAQVEAQLQLVKLQLQRTTLVAPFSGLVTSGDLSQSLGSPVERGEILYEVAPTDTYRVVMKIDDRDIGLLARGQQGQLKLSGLPNQTIGIKVERLTPVSTSGEGRNYFRVEAIMDSQSDLMRPGMEGVAKIDIGEEKLLWILSRRLVEWFRMFAWNRLP